MVATISRVFPVAHVDRVRFRDVNSRQHVNNAVFSSYLEQARLDWFEQTGGDEPSPTSYAVDMILARTEIDFRSPLLFGETVEVGVSAVSATRASTSSTSYAPAAASSPRQRACSSATTSRTA